MAVPPRAFSLLESSRAEWWQVGVAEGFEMRRESLRGLLPTLGREGREGCKIIAEMAGRENSKSVRFGGLFHLNASGTSSTVLYLATITRSASHRSSFTAPHRRLLT